MQKQNHSPRSQQSKKNKSQTLRTSVQRSPQQIVQRSLNGVQPSHDELIQLQSAMGNRAFQKLMRSSAVPPTKQTGDSPSQSQLTIQTQPTIRHKAHKNTIQPKRSVLGRIGFGALSTIGWTATGFIPGLVTGAHEGYKKFGVGGGIVGGFGGLLAGGLGGVVGGIGSIVAASTATFGTKRERKGLDKKGNDLSKSVESLNRSILRTFTVSEVTIPSTWGYGTLKGRKYAPKLDSRENKSNVGNGKVVIMFSGSGGTNEKQLGGVASEYCARGYTAYGIDYRGFGKSSQRKMLSEAGMYDDAMRIYKYVRKQEGISDGNIVIHGFSLGGAVASHLVKTLASKKKRVGGLVLHSAIDSAYRVANRAGQEDFNSVLGFYGGVSTKAGVGDFDTIGHLKSLSKQNGYDDLPIHFMSGTHKENSNRTDHLDLNVTGLEDKATKFGFNNLSSGRSNFDHMRTQWHMLDQDESMYSQF